MSEELIVKHCAPTLAGLKVGNMFTSDYKDRSEVINYITRINKQLVPKGLRMIPLRYSEERVLIYLYRPKRLKYIFNEEMTKEILDEYGYCHLNINLCIRRLCDRIALKKDFPHEVGLFLGYPAEDVLGFINNKAQKEKCVGCWKVYGDVEKAKKTFQKYKKCTHVYENLFQLGKSIEGLTVAD